MSIYKEDIEQAKERLSAWWDHELIDRPNLLYAYPRPDVSFPGLYDLWYLAKKWDDIEGCLDDFEKKSEALIFGGEWLPWFWPNYGPGIMASVLGVNPRFEEQTQTVWFNRPTPVEELESHLESVELNQNNPWYVRLVKITEYAAKRAGKNYSVAMTDLGGIMDILSSFLGPTNLIVTLKRKPEIVDACRSIILEKYLKVYDELQDIIEQYNGGSNSWIPIWCPKRYYTLQCDFAAMLSPKYFKRFVLSDLRAQAEHMDYAIYHLDGARQIVHIDDLLAEPSITAIQWVPGDGAAPASDEKWFSLYKKIESAGKGIIVDNPGSTPEASVQLYKQFNPKFLIMPLIFLSDVQAQYYLPEFVGGNGAKSDYKEFRREYRKKLKAIKNN